MPQKAITNGLHLLLQTQFHIIIVDNSNATIINRYMQHPCSPGGHPLCDVGSKLQCAYVKRYFTLKQ